MCIKMDKRHNLGHMPASKDSNRPLNTIAYVTAKMAAMQTRIPNGVDSPNLFYKQIPETVHECMRLDMYAKVT